MGVTVSMVAPSTMKGLGTQRLPLGADDLTTCLGICFQLVILCLPLAELLSAAGLLHMLHTDMDTLPDDAAINLKIYQFIRNQNVYIDSTLSLTV